MCNNANSTAWICCPLQRAAWGSCPYGPLLGTPLDTDKAHYVIAVWRKKKKVAFELLQADN